MMPGHDDAVMNIELLVNEAGGACLLYDGALPAMPLTAMLDSRLCQLRLKLDNQHELVINSKINSALMEWLLQAGTILLCRIDDGHLAEGVEIPLLTVLSDPPL